MKVAIIGAGPSGLSSIKSCVEENLEPVCFERETSLGGLWKFSEVEGHSSVYKSTVINTSKEMSCFSDFPVPKRFSVFMQHNEVMEYLQLYSSNFNLYKYITFNTKVIQIQKADDYSYSGKWQVKYQTQGSDVEMRSFDAVMVCTGHHWCPSLPSFSGIKTFERRQIHSHSYKDSHGFENKKVLVVGRYSFMVYQRITQIRLYRRSELAAIVYVYSFVLSLFLQKIVTKNKFMVCPCVRNHNFKIHFIDLYTKYQSKLPTLETSLGLGRV
jgi:uncharacterized NAD(P)/FAD-binding protein YdhS